MSYAKVLGATHRQDGYLEGNGYLVSWCVGHLVELAPPNIYDEKYVKWSLADLPILPQKWQYLVSASTKKQFGILQKLMHRPDVESIVNSCDSGREGEVIFRLVYQQVGCKKPFSRLWLSSMEETAIREGFAHLKPSTEYDALYNAALCRERADWMVGINASRLFSCLYGQPLAVGRVMTPVLAMTVVREAAISAFVPEKFYTVDLELTSGCTASSRRIPEKAVAENLLEACRREMVATIQRITRKEKSESPPSLYDLTTLQRDANRLLGYSAQQTLDYVQSLYEKKLTTYPRTDSCYITDDDEEMLEELTEALEVFLDITPENVDEAVPRTRCTVNREKVTDHHAIPAHPQYAASRSGRTAQGGAERPEAHHRPDADGGEQALPVSGNSADHRMCRGGIYRQGQGGFGGRLESGGAQGAGRHSEPETGAHRPAQCSGKRVRHSQRRAKGGANDPAEAFY